MTTLSICIATYNRAGFIGETLDSIINQLQPGVEVVIVDGASPDDTSSVVSGYVTRLPAVRYFREAQNSGVDADYDKAVGYAKGEHCWLFPDDDLLAPGAVARALEALEGGAVDLLIVDSEIRDRSLARKLNPRRLSFTGERNYGPEDADAFLRDAGDVLTFIGGTVVRRQVWMDREREKYFGSLFVHVGVIFQAPAIRRIKVLGESLVMIRAGNAMWRPRSFEIWAFKWPTLIWSFDGYSDAAKRHVTPREPWGQPVWIFAFRAMGAYSLNEYKENFSTRKVGLRRILLFLAAALPGPLANFLNVFLLLVTGRSGDDVIYDLIKCSRFSNPASEFLANMRLGKTPPARAV